MNRNIICMKWGTRYPADYVNRLFNMVSRHLSGEFRFVCFTDDPKGVLPGVECLPIPDIELPEHLANKPWKKLVLWQKPLADLEGQALFLDLDVVITGSLDAFFTYEPESYCVIHNWTEPKETTGNTSVFRLTIGKYPYIYDNIVGNMDKIYANYKIEQRYISKTIEDGAQKFWPAQWCRSFKHEMIPAWPLRFFKIPLLPDDCKIAVFHGLPDPDDAAIGVWPVKKRWKKLYKFIKPAPWITENWR